MLLLTSCWRLYRSKTTITHANLESYLFIFYLTSHGNHLLVHLGPQTLLWCMPKTSPTDGRDGVTISRPHDSKSTSKSQKILFILKFKLESLLQFIGVFFSLILNK